MWFVLAALVLVATLGAQAQQVVNTNGGGGPACPPGNCAVNAECIGGECVCKLPWVWGDGRLCCYRRNQVGAKIFNDPTLKTFNNETAPFPYPCRYLVTDVSQELKINKQVVGTCRCQIHAWNHRHRGKFYVAGYDYSCNIRNDETPADSFGFSIRKAGIASGGTYAYSIWGSNSYTPNGPWTGTPVDINQGGVKVKCEVDPQDNVARVFVRACGLEAYLRAYDVVLRRQQPQTPGLNIGVNCAHHPVFHQHDRVMALAPVDWGGQFLEEIRYLPLDVDDSVLLRAFTQSSDQNQPNAPDECERVGARLHYCTEAKRIEAAQTCFWMLRRARFIRCINGPPDDNGQKILEVLHRCIEYVCDFGLCSNALKPITDAGCWAVPNTPELASYALLCA